MIKLLLAAFSAGLLLSSALAEEASVKEDASAKEDASMKAALAASVNEALAKRTATRFVPTGTKRSLTAP